MKLCNIHIKNLIILSVSGIFKGFKNWQKVAEICYQLAHDRAGRGLALFMIWRHRLIYMALTLCEHACMHVQMHACMFKCMHACSKMHACMHACIFDVKPGIDPCPSPARSWDKAYQISGCTVAQRKMLRKKVRLLLEQLQVCIFAKIVFGVRCTLNTDRFIDLFKERWNERTNEWTSEWMNERMNEWMNEWMESRWSTYSKWWALTWQIL